MLLLFTFAGILAGAINSRRQFQTLALKRNAYPAWNKRGSGGRLYLLLFVVAASSSQGYTSARFYKMWKGEVWFQRLRDRNQDSQRSGQHYWGLEENDTSDCFFAPPACLGSANMVMCIQRNDQFCCFSDWIHANQFEWLSHLRCLLEMFGASMDLPAWFWRYPGTVFCIFFILDLFIWGEALRDTPRAGIKMMTMITMHWWILQSSLGHLRTVKESCTVLLKESISMCEHDIIRCQSSHSGAVKAPSPLEQFHSPQCLRC